MAGLEIARARRVPLPSSRLLPFPNQLLLAVAWSRSSHAYSSRHAWGCASTSCFGRVDTLVRAGVFGQDGREAKVLGERIELTSPTSIRPKYCSSWIPREDSSRTIRLEKRGHIGTQACLPLVSCFFPGPPACGAPSSVSLEDGPEVRAVSSTRLLDFHPFHPSSDMATMTTAHAVT